jgi:hypothetical protein
VTLTADYFITAANISSQNGTYIYSATDCIGFAVTGSFTYNGSFSAITANFDTIGICDGSVFLFNGVLNLSISNMHITTVSFRSTLAGRYSCCIVHIYRTS